MTNRTGDAARGDTRLYSSACIPRWILAESGAPRSGPVRTNRIGCSSTPPFSDGPENAVPAKRHKLTGQGRPNCGRCDPLGERYPQISETVSGCTPQSRLICCRSRADGSLGPEDRKVNKFSFGFQTTFHSRYSLPLPWVPFPDIFRQSPRHKRKPPRKALLLPPSLAAGGSIGKPFPRLDLCPAQPENSLDKA